MNQIRLWLLRILIVLILAIAFSTIGLDIQKNALADLFTVIGIIYTLAIGFMLGFSFQEIYDADLRNKFKNIVKDCFVVFTVLFGISALLHTLCPDFTVYFWVLNLEYQFLVVFWDLFSLGYYCFNFNKLRKLRNNIDDCIRQGRIDRERYGKG